MRRSVEVLRDISHFGGLATDSLGFYEQSTHFPEESSSALRIVRGLEF